MSTENDPQRREWEEADIDCDELVYKLDDASAIYDRDLYYIYLRIFRVVENRQIANEMHT